MSGADTAEIILATRGSDLAVRQTDGLAGRLREHGLGVDLLEVETTGDRIDDELIENLGTTGAFVHNLDQEVLAGSADFAVHSMKDMPTESPTDLVVVAVPERAPAGDVLVTPEGKPLEELPSGATVGTASVRRKAQLLRARPDLAVEPIRGNVDTRIEKLLAPSLQSERERRQEADDDVEEWVNGLTDIERRALDRAVEDRYDGVVLAKAGLIRSGFYAILPTSDLPTSEFVPAPAQGALAVVGGDGDLSDRIRAALELPRSRLECAVERAVLAGIGGGCIAPIGVHAQLKGDVIHVRAIVLEPGGTEAIDATRDLPVERAVAGGRDLAETMLDRGAGALLTGAGFDTDRGESRETE